MPDDQIGLRVRALELANANSVSDEAASDTVARADAYFAFIVGNQPTPRRERRSGADESEAKLLLLKALALKGPMHRKELGKLIVPLGYNPFTVNTHLFLLKKEGLVMNKSMAKYLKKGYWTITIKGREADGAALAAAAQMRAAAAVTEPVTPEAESVAAALHRLSKTRVNPA